MNDRIIFALDVSTRRKAYEWCRRLQGHIGLVKVGLELFTQFGPDILDAPESYGLGVMLDLKLHDIPNTVGNTVGEWFGREEPIRFITVHASGGAEMIRRAVHTHFGANVAAVTVLTSLDREECESIYGRGPAMAAGHLAKQAVEAGAGALVCSGHEVAALRAAYSDVKLIVPGVRPMHAKSHDQKRIVTPQQAVVDGADFLVVGRYIREAADPVSACGVVADGIAKGMEKRSK